MSNETKRDVFDDLVEELANVYIALDSEGIGKELTNEEKQAYLKDYDNALPDDLPVIPKDVCEWLTWCKEHGHSLKDALDGETRVSEDTFARAWVLGVWRVEKTGEIVELEVADDGIS